MPANLPPDYFAAEERFRAARTPEDKIEALEEMLAVMPKHKGTDKLKAMLRERISKFRAQAQERKGTGKQKTAYSIEKEGAAQAVIVGPPNTGKSSLVALVTNAAPEVAPFPHTTHRPTPGMMEFENIQFQLIDTPPITRQYTDPSLLDLLRRTDIIILMLDLTADPMGQYEETMSILHEARLYSPQCPLPDNLPKRPFVKNFLIIVNKMDRPEDQEALEIFRELSGVTPPCLGLSAKTGLNVSSLPQTIFSLAGILRVYTKRPGREADMTAPFIIPTGSVVEELASRIHKEFAVRLKYARIWGKGVRDGQMVPRNHVLQDGNIVEFCI
ncbi:MAG: TGS domain-containing protein [Syntrophobacterales bacterium]|nr:TGS domain-containing protein [Syntrophobacterales bacterium]